jgi:phosphatidylserine/phosphatidylglycerophosphate/cardiolipin synthase-like enzyme
LKEKKMAKNKKKSNTNRNIIAAIAAIIVFVIALLGATGVVDLVALDDALEPIIGERIFQTEAITTAAQPPTPVTESSASGDWWEVMFTSPGVEENYIAEELIRYINAASTTIHIASFEFNLNEVATALINAHQRGVEVEWVTDDEYGIEADQEEGHGQFAMMEDDGIEVKDDGRGALMHNKFWIFDDAIVWTGSTNITHNGTLLNNNNVIVLKSQAVAEIFEREFQEMWTEGKYGPTSPSTVSQQDVIIDGSTISVRFGPEDEVAAYLADLLATAQTQIRFMAFSFTQDDMGGTILARAQNGVDVAGIFETRGSETEYSELPAMYCAGLSVRQDGNPETFHHKVLIIDGHIVVTGSFNFTSNADESNDENVVVIDNADIAAQYLEEFDRRWSEAVDLAPADITCP